MDCNSIWAELQTAIKKAIASDVSYSVHIKAAKPISYDNSVFTIAVPNSINRTMIDYRFKDKIEGIIEVYTGQRTSLKVVLESELNAPEEVIPPTPSPSEHTDNSVKASATQHFYINEKFTFENFVVGSSNEYAASAAISASENPGFIYNPLFLYGNSGLGKTHLMCAIGNKIKKEHPDYKVIYIPAENFTNEFIDCIKNNKLNNSNNSMEEFRNKYRNADVLLVDDVQFLQNKEGFQEEFFHTFNALQNKNRQIVLTSDKKPSDLKLLDERLQSRFMQGLNIDISVPNYETRIAILRKKAEINNYNVKDEVLEYIADRIKSNVRELEGALLKVISIAQLTRKEVDIELATYAIDSILPKDGIVKMTPERIIEKVSTFYNVTREEILGESRVKQILVPRQVAMYLCSKLTEMNHSMIGRAFNNKDRTSVRHNVNKVEVDIKTDMMLKTDIEYITRDLQSI